MAEDPRSEEAHADFTMRACKINRAQLDRILEVAVKDIENPDIKLSTVRTGSGITSKITGGTVDELLKNVKQSTMSGDPERIDNLEAHIFAHGIHRHEFILINIDSPDSIVSNEVSVRVSGADPGWVVGRTSQLKDLFAATRPSHSSYVSRLSNTRYFSPFVALVVVAVLIPPILGSSTLKGRSSAQVALGIGMFLFVAGLSYLLGSKLDRFTRTELLIPSPSARPPRDWVNIGVLIVTIIGVLVGIAAIIVAHSDATKAHSFGPVHGVQVSLINTHPEPSPSSEQVS